jgi:hypothetical protein
MELKIEEVQLPEQIKFNFEELKTELTAKAHEYKVTVYTEDKIKEAKSDRASLNKLKKALNDERIRLEKEYMKPFNEFKSQINEIIGIVDEPIGIIDGQIKDFEQRKKDEKRDAIIELWNNREKPEFLEDFDLFNEKWLNSTYTMAKVEADIDEIIAKTMDDLKTLESLPEFGFEAVEEYKRTLSLQQAIAEGKRLADIQKRKEEQERLQKEAEEKARLAAEEAEKAKDAEMEKALQEEEERIQNEPTKENVSCETSEPAAEEPTRAWVGFKALLSKEEARALGEFITAHNIKIKKIEL